MIGEPRECPIDFNTFVLSLSSNALSAVSGAEGGEQAARSHSVMLALAKQTVDILELLEEKTSGNLTGEEERLLNQVLQDVRDHLQSVQEGNG